MKVPFDDFIKVRASYNGKNEEQKRSWLLDYFTQHTNPSKTRTVCLPTAHTLWYLCNLNTVQAYIVHGVPVCAKSFCNCYGISNNKLTDARAAWKANQENTEDAR